MQELLFKFFLIHSNEGVERAFLRTYSSIGRIIVLIDTEYHALLIVHVYHQEDLEQVLDYIMEEALYYWITLSLYFFLLRLFH